MANKTTKTLRRAGVNAVDGTKTPHTFEKLRENLAKLPKELKLEHKVR